MWIKKTGSTSSYGFWEVQFTVKVQWAGLLKGFERSYDLWEEKITVKMCSEQSKETAVYLRGKKVQWAGLLKGFGNSCELRKLVQLFYAHSGKCNLP